MAYEAETGMGRREQKKRETRRAIRHAALDLALQGGLEHLTVEAIAQAAGISPRTFFNYFASKEDALVTQADAGAAQVSQLLLERPAHEPPMQALRNAIITSEYFGVEPVERDRILARQRLTQENPSLMAHHLGKIAAVERTLAQALAERMGTDLEDDVYPELLAAVALSTIRVAVRRWVAKGTQPLEELLEAAFERLERMDLNAAHTAAFG